MLMKSPALRAKNALQTQGLPAGLEAQPMIPAHDLAALRVFAGTWQSPADL